MTEATLVEYSDLTCDICRTAVNQSLSLGEKYKISNTIVHYFCVLLSKNAKQRGADKEGVWGFLHQDIQFVIKQSIQVECFYCGETGASIFCQTCKKPFHLPCGSLHNAASVFQDNFPTYCVDHRPKQTIPISIITDGIANPPLCVVCMEIVDVEDRQHSMWAPCCRKSWFHRPCLQQLALSQGLLFKCPACSNGNKFKVCAVKLGIFVPHRDASWELEPDAFASMENKTQCDVDKCLCDGGRTLNEEDTQWELLVCCTCGSNGVHKGCAILPESCTEWQCDECNKVLNLAVTDSQEPVPSTSESANGIVSRYQCTFDGCTSWFQHSYLLKIHELKHTECPITEPSTSLENVDVEDKPYKCDFQGCSSQFKHSSLLIRHKRSHRRPTASKCRFNGCSRLFFQAYQLKHHLLRHIDSLLSQDIEKPYACKFNDCPAQFPLKWRLKTHMLKHVNKTSYKYVPKLIHQSLSRLVIRHVAVKHKISTGNSSPMSKKITKKIIGMACVFDGCPEVSATKSSFSRHQLVHTKDHPRKCKQCSASFIKGSNFSRHLKKHKEALKAVPPSRKKYNGFLNLRNQKKSLGVGVLLKCHINGCNLKFLHLIDLKMHLKKHTGEKPAKCTFATCNSAFSKKSDLRKHLLRHNSKPFLCTFRKCNMTFTRRDRFNAHLSMHNANRLLCKFADCNFSSADRRTLNAHLLMYHRYKCDFCLVSFDSENSLKNHLKQHTKNTGNERYACHYDGCQASFKLSSELKMHKEFHSDEKIFHCSIKECSRKFYSQNGLNSHMRRHRRFKCSYFGCTASFSNIYDLNAHHSLHAKKTPYKCQHRKCAEAFTNRSDLKSHARKHMKVMRYICAYNDCKLNFKSSHELEDHQKRHYAELSIKCPFISCNKVFLSRDEFKLHTRNHLKCNYGTCTATFETRSGLKRHSLRHKVLRPYKCDYFGCKASFDNLGKLNIHSKWHLEETPFKCSYCSRAFKLDLNLQKHLLLHTNDGLVNDGKEFCGNPSQDLKSKIVSARNTPYKGLYNFGASYKASSILKYHLMRQKYYKCTYGFCVRKFKRYIELQQHRKKHKERKLKCPYYRCLFSSDFRNKLNKHIAKHEMKSPFTCSICCRAFDEISKLVNHQNEGCTSSIEPADQISENDIINDGKFYKCTFNDCTATFTQEVRFQNHLLTHAPRNLSSFPKDARYKCNFGICKRIFYSSKQLKIHKILHLGFRPHKCSYDGCTAAFSSSRDLKRHKNYHGSKMKNNSSLNQSQPCRQSFRRRAKENPDKVLNQVQATVLLSQEELKLNLNGRLPVISDANFQNRINEKEILTENLTSESTSKRSNVVPTFNTFANLKNHQLCHSSQVDLSPKTSSDSQSHDCDDGKVTFHLGNDLQRHDGEETFTCDVCQWVFNFEADLEVHQENVHNCGPPDSNTNSLNPSYLNNHSSRTYQCGYIGCRFICKSASRYVIHRRSHYHSFKCNVRGCTATYLKYIALKVHKKIHTTISAFKCDNVGCTLGFEYLKHLNGHKAKHCCFGPLKCKYNGCPATFLHSSLLKEHEMNHEYKFDECNITVEEPHQLQNASVSDKSNGLSNFNYGEDSLMKQSNYENLNQSNSCKTFNCNASGVVSTKKLSGPKKRHGKIHGNVTLFKCDYVDCTAAYMKKSKLITHKRTHTSYGNIKCKNDRCLATFDNYIDVKTHERRFCSYAANKCKYDGCMASFSFLSDRDDHYRFHCNNLPLNYNYIGGGDASQDRISNSNGDITAKSANSRTPTTTTPNMGRLYKYPSEGCVATLRKELDFKGHQLNHDKGENAYKSPLDACTAFFINSAQLERYQSGHINAFFSSNTANDIVSQGKECRTGIENVVKYEAENSFTGEDAVDHQMETSIGNSIDLNVTETFPVMSQCAESSIENDCVNEVDPGAISHGETFRNYIDPLGDENLEARQKLGDASTNTLDSADNETSFDNCTTDPLGDHQRVSDLYSFPCISGEVFADDFDLAKRQVKHSGDSSHQNDYVAPDEMGNNEGTNDEKTEESEMKMMSSPQENENDLWHLPSNLHESEKSHDKACITVRNDLKSHQIPQEEICIEEDVKMEFKAGEITYSRDEPNLWGTFNSMNNLQSTALLNQSRETSCYISNDGNTESSAQGIIDAVRESNKNGSNTNNLHKKKNKLMCDICLKFLSCKSSLNRHKKIHTGEKPFKCMYCEKAYSDRESFFRHSLTANCL